MTLYEPPTQTSGHYSVVADKQHNLIWSSEHQVDMISRLDPKIREWIEFPLDQAETDARRIEIDPTNPNRIFFSGHSSGRVGSIELLP